jgi:ABC-type xylose transport system permease subunit
LVYPSVGCIVANIPVVVVIILAGRLNNSGLLEQPESTFQKQLAELLVMAAFFGILGGCALAGAVGFVFGALLGMERAARASLASESLAP